MAPEIPIGDVERRRDDASRSARPAVVGNPAGVDGGAARAHRTAQRVGQRLDGLEVALRPAPSRHHHAGVGEVGPLALHRLEGDEADLPGGRIVDDLHRDDLAPGERRRRVRTRSAGSWPPWHRGHDLDLGDDVPGPHRPAQRDGGPSPPKPRTSVAAPAPSRAATRGSRSFPAPSRRRGPSSAGIARASAARVGAWRSARYGASRASSATWTRAPSRSPPARRRPRRCPAGPRGACRRCGPPARGRRRGRSVPPSGGFRPSARGRRGRWASVSRSDSAFASSWSRRQSLLDVGHLHAALAAAGSARRGTRILGTSSEASDSAGSWRIDRLPGLHDPRERREARLVEPEIAGDDRGEVERDHLDAAVHLARHLQRPRRWPRGAARLALLLRLALEALQLRGAGRLAAGRAAPPRYCPTWFWSSSIDCFPSSARSGSSFAKSPRGAPRRRAGRADRRAG